MNNSNLASKALLCLLMITFTAWGQSESPETLQVALEKAQSLKERIDLLNKLSHAYSQLSLESAEQFAEDALERSVDINYQKGIASSYNNLGICKSIRGDYTSGLDYFIKALQIRESEKDILGTSNVLNNISRLFIYQNEYDKALEYSTKSLELLKTVNDDRAVANAHISMGTIYMSKNDPGKALQMYTIARDNFVKNGLRIQEGWSLLKIANAWAASGDYEMALASCFEAKELLDPKADLFTTIELYQTIGSIYATLRDATRATDYLRQAVRMADEGHDSNGRMTSMLKLSEVFKTFGHYDSALYYNETYLKLHAEVFNAEKARQLATLEKIYQSEKKDQILEAKNQQIESQSIIITVISVLLVVLAILGFIIFRYYRDKRRSNIELERLNRDIYEKHEEILVQAEELTQANQEISRINESLEEEVYHRTEKIERQNKMLIDYAYSNAHNVRGPLARILGLASLMSREDDPVMLREYNTFIYVSAQELDNVIREINIRLQEEV